MKTLKTTLPKGKILEIITYPEGSHSVVQELVEETGNQENTKKYYGIIDLANYLKLLFYKTNKKYSCTRTKIGKLLSILAFKYARKNSRVFLNDIYRYPQCGTYIRELSVFCERDEYIMPKYMDNNMEMSLEEIDWNIITPMDNKDFTHIPLNLRKEIEVIFCKFGAYSQMRLGECLNCIVDYEGVCASDQIVNLDRIAELSIHDINKIGRNKVIDYIFSE